VDALVERHRRFAKGAAARNGACSLRLGIRSGRPQPLARADDGLALESEPIAGAPCLVASERDLFDIAKDEKLWSKPVFLGRLSMRERVVSAFHTFLTSFLNQYLYVFRHFFCWCPGGHPF